MDDRGPSDDDRRDPARSLWNEFYASTDPDSAWGPPNPFYDSLLGRLPASPAVLDLGCGDGRHAMFFAERGAVVVAVDISDVALDRLSHRARHLRSRISFERCDIGGPFEFGAFDLTICHGVLNSVEPDRWTDTMNRIKDHTKPGGICCVTVFNRTLTQGLPHPYVLADISPDFLVREPSDWSVIERREWVREHDHDGIGRHRHEVQLVAARRALADGNEPKLERPPSSDA